MSRLKNKLRIATVLLLAAFFFAIAAPLSMGCGLVFADGSETESTEEIKDDTDGITNEEIEKKKKEEEIQKSQEEFRKEQETDRKNTVNEVDAGQMDDLDKVRAQLKLVTILPDENTEEYITTIRSDGSWPSSVFPYTSLDNSLYHLVRLRRMAGEYVNANGRWYMDEELKNKIVSGVDYWFSLLDAELKVENRYNSLISQWQQLVQIFMQLYGHVETEWIVQYAVRIPDLETEGIKNIFDTGTNLTWVCSNVIYRGALTGNEEDIASAAAHIWKAISFSGDEPGIRKEGPQVDGSYLLHYEQLYNNGYGKSFLSDAAQWIDRLGGTKFQPPPDKLEVLERMVLEGNRWMRRGRYYDVTTDGRDFCRYGIEYTGLEYVARVLAKCGSARADELLQLSADIMDESGTKPTVIGNRCFWIADYMAHHREKYSSSVKVSSYRTVRTEQNENENIYGYWWQLGLTTLYKRGDDYRNIWQFYDFSRLAGETVPQKLVLIQPQEWSGRNFSHRATFVGGVSDGMYGAECMRQNIDGVRANKAWFYFDDEFVSLGSDIRGAAIESIGTTIEQRYLSGDVLVDGRPAARGIRTYKDVNTVYHDEIGYVFPKKETVNLKNQTVWGTYSNLGGYYMQYDKNLPDHADMFLLWIDHGKKIANEDYAFITVPVISKEDFAEYSKDIPIRIIENSKNLQCVSHDGLKIAQFFVYKPMTFRINDDLSITAKNICAGMVKQDDDKIELTVSDPYQKSREFVFEIAYKGEKYDVTVELPKRIYAGQSVTVTVNAG